MLLFELGLAGVQIGATHKGEQGLGTPVEQTASPGLAAVGFLSLRLEGGEEEAVLEAEKRDRRPP